MRLSNSLSMRCHWAFIWACVGVAVGTASRAEQSAPGPEDLPPDEPRSAAVIYDLKYAVARVNELEVGATSLSGDKYLSTYGVSIDDRYHLNENFAVGLGASFFTSSLSSEASTLTDQGVPPIAYNPSWLARGTILFEPVYGKFLVGSAIAHFKLGVEAGGVLAHETLAQNLSGLSGLTSSAPIQNSRTAPGPLAGLRFETYLGNRLSLIGSADFMLLGTLPGDGSGSTRRLWAYTVGMGCRF